MSFAKKTIRDVPIEHKTVLVRADYNVPLNDAGEIDDDYRLTQSLPTLQYLIKAGCKVIVCSHLGRPDGKVNHKESLEPVAVRLGELLKQPVAFIPDCIGDRVKVAASKLPAGGVLLLENLRFHAQEEANDKTFAQHLAKDTGAQYFVQDGFGVVHRAHASTDAITHFLPSVAGLLIEKEVSTIARSMHHPERPLVAVMGGAKVSDKIKVLERFIGIADQLIIGGAMANTFFKYKGMNIGKSVFESGQEAELDRIYELAKQKVGAERVDDFLLLATDAVVADKIEPKAHAFTVALGDITPPEYILDMGPKSIAAMLQHVRGAAMVIWNGTLGYAEYPAFAVGSAKLAQALADQKHHTFSLIGGGDTADFALHWDKQKGGSFGHVSTGGGASMELMSGKKLPGVEALMDK